MGSFTARSARAGLALCIGALCANGALAQSQRPLSLGDMLFDRHNGRKPATPPVARYVAEDAVAFVFDVSGSQPLIRFEGSDEIWALFPQDAPRGDIIYKNDVGETVLRATRLGGLTVFTSTRPEGAAAALRSVVSQSLQLPQAVMVLKRLKSASDRASRAAGRQVGVVGPDIGPDSVAVAIDAATVAAEAFERLSRSQRNAGALQGVNQILLLEGQKASVELKRRSLIITVVPGRSFVGRPSSAKIAKALKG